MSPKADSLGNTTHVGAVYCWEVAWLFTHTLAIITWDVGGVSHQINEQWVACGFTFNNK